MVTSTTTVEVVAGIVGVDGPVFGPIKHRVAGGEHPHDGDNVITALVLLTGQQGFGMHGL